MNKQEQNKTTTYTNKVFDGKQLNFMYFLEVQRRIAVAYTYNKNTNQGAYTAAIWHALPDDSKNKSWNKKAHRETAIQRYEKCSPIPFEIKFEDPHSVFFLKLKKLIRKQISKNGVKGARGNKFSEDTFLNVDTSETSNNIIKLDEIIPYPTRRATKSSIQEQNNKKQMINTPTHLADNVSN